MGVVNLHKVVALVELASSIVAKDQAAIGSVAIVDSSQDGLVILRVGEVTGLVIFRTRDAHQLDGGLSLMMRSRRRRNSERASWIRAIIGLR